ncbi:MAG: NUMOD3 domain-containing DNA-binding protein [Bacteroidota bacterium]|nr:NUMOD3 domain-containing DNA-binding protein [Bacteroidota bacterium]
MNEEALCGIYLIESPNGRIYIGQSVDIFKRWKSYKKLSNCKSQIKLYRSLKKYGVENHSFHIAFECSEEDLNKEERFYQEVFDVCGKEGLNCKLTETDDRSGKMSPEACKKISVAMKGKKGFWEGKKMSFEAKKKMSEKAKNKKLTVEHKAKFNYKGKEHTDEWKKNISQINKGKKHSDETKQKIGLAQKGRKHSEEHKRKISEGLKNSHKNKNL